MFPPTGFKSELYPLRHRLVYSYGLSINDDTDNTAFMTFVRHSSDIDTAANLVVVNPHNTNYVEDTGAVCQKMSIIDKLTMSLKFNMTQECLPKAHTSGQSTSEIFTGDGIQAISLLWRPIFFSFSEKLAAADDDTGTTVEAILGLTSDATNEDVVPLTTNKLAVTGSSDFAQPVSTVNQAEVFTDINYTTNTTMEDHVWDEDLFQAALRRYTNKGALRSMVGQTRNLTLTSNRPYKNFYINKFVPKAIRRIQPYSFFGIQVHVPLDSDVNQHYLSANPTAAVAHVGVKCIVNYHEWNIDHYQDMTGTGA